MRTTDPDPKPLGPVVGERVQRPAPATPTHQPVPSTPHIERGPDGRLRTNLPLPR